MNMGKIKATDFKLPLRPGNVDNYRDDECCNTARKERPVVISCDEESWLLQSLTDLVDVALQINKTSRNSEASKQAVRGAIHGAAVDVLRSIGLDTSYSNIKRL